MKFSKMFEIFQNYVNLWTITGIFLQCNTIVTSKPLPPPLPPPPPWQPPMPAVVAVMMMVPVAVVMVVVVDNK